MYYCKKCNKKCEVNFGSGIFCSRNCANSRERTSEVRQKISKGIKACDAYKEGRLNPRKGKSKYTNIERTCPVCNTTYTTTTARKNKFCSIPCAHKSPSLGGYRLGSGRSKCGWYKGFYCGSSWELAYLIWCLDHNTTVQRCNETFDYIFEGRKRLYMPDFKIDDTYVEIKGFMTKQVEEKIKQFPKKLLILSREDLSHVFDYVMNKYGKDFVNLYEGSPHDQKLNQCKLCDKPSKNQFCSRRCAMLGARKLRKCEEKVVTLLGAAPSSPP